MLLQEGIDFTDAPKYLELLKVEMADKRKPSQQALLFYLYNNNLLVYMGKTGQFDKALEILPGIVQDYSRHGKELNPFQKTNLLLKISVTWFLAKEYGKCLQYLNRIRNELSFRVQPDVDYFLYVFYIIVHYEARHYDLLPSLIQSADYFSKKQMSLNKLENLFILFFRKNLPKTDAGVIPAEAFMELQKSVLPLTKDPHEKHSFQNFDYLSYVQSKTENLSFAEVIKEKIRK